MRQLHWFEETKCKIHVHLVAREWMSDAGAAFDAAALVAMAKEAGVDHMEIFIKDLFGTSYYPTHVGRQSTPMKAAGRDYLAELLEHARPAGIRVLAYYSMNIDIYHGLTNPDWVCRTWDDRPLMINMRNESTSDPNEARSCWICLNSPYREVALGQLEEIVRGYEVDGIWMDGFIQPTPIGACYCRHCRDKFTRETGLAVPIRHDSTDPSFAAFQRFQRQTEIDVCREMNTRLKSIRPGLVITWNGAGWGWLGNEALGPGWYGVSNAELLPYCDAHSAESWEFQSTVLPPQPLFFDTSFKSRYYRGWPQMFEIETVGSMRRSTSSWEWKPANQLKLQQSVVLANGGSMAVSVNPLHTGAVRAGELKSLGELFRWTNERKPWVLGAQTESDVALFMGKGDETRGFHKALCEAHAQFDMLTEELVHPLDGYRVVILPEVSELAEGQVEAIREFVKAGGALVATGSTLLSGGKFVLEDVFGVRYGGLSCFADAYMNLVEPALAEGLPDMPLLVQQRVVQAIPESAKAAAWLVNPVSDQWSDQRFVWQGVSPPERQTEYVMMALNSYGKGWCLYIAGGIGAEFYFQDDPWLGRLIANIVEMLVPDPLVKTSAPMHVETTLTRQGDRRVLHLVNHYACPQAVSSPLPEFKDIEVAIRSRTKPGNVYLAPEKQELPWSLKGDYVRCTVPRLQIHGMVVVE